MITSAVRTELEEGILTCCRSLFLTSAIPEMIRKNGTPKQIEYPLGTDAHFLHVFTDSALSDTFA